MNVRAITMHVLLLPLTFMFIGISPVNAKEVKLSSRELTQLIDEYCKDPADKREAEIIEQLRNEEAKKCAGSIRTNLGKEELRAKALELAITLKVPGLFNDAKKYIDETSLESSILALGLLTRDSGADKFIINRWTSPETGAESVSAIESALLSYSVSSTGLEELKKVMSGETTSEGMKESARVILNRQLGADDFSAEKLNFDWKRLVKEWETNAKAWPIKGIDITTMECCKWTGSAHRIGDNFLLSEGASAELSPYPNSWHKIGITIKFRVRVADGTGTFVKLTSKNSTGAQMLWTLNHEEGVWALTTGAGTKLSQPYKLGEWAEIAFVIRGATEGDESWNRLTIKVNDKPVIETCQIYNEVSEFLVKTGGGKVTLGGFEMVKG